MADSIPEFNSEGLLPAGDYEMTFGQLRASHLVQDGDLSCEHWDVSWRLWLVDQFEVLVKQLWQVGIDDIFADGSFAENKAHPNDIDGYFVCERDFLASGQLQQELNLLDPQKVWTWDPRSRTLYMGYPKKQLPMWHVYRVELYPHFSGLSSGIKDKHGNELEFPSAFRRSRLDGQQRGIIKVVKG